jgi:6-pyruvoyl-tetrahydropterin synthase
MFHDLTKLLQTHLHPHLLPVLIEFVDPFLHTTAAVSNAKELQVAVEQMVQTLDDHSYGSWEEKIWCFSNETLFNIVKHNSDETQVDLIEQVRMICSNEHEGDDYRAHKYPISFLMDGLLIRDNCRFLSPEDRQGFLAKYRVESITHAERKQNQLIELAECLQEFECRGIATVRSFYDVAYQRYSEMDNTPLQKILCACRCEDEDGDFEPSGTFERFWEVYKSRNDAYLIS